MQRVSGEEFGPVAASDRGRRGELGGGSCHCEDCPIDWVEEERADWGRPWREVVSRKVRVCAAAVGCSWHHETKPLAVPRWAGNMSVANAM